jgi:hypothetical protein
MKASVQGESNKISEKFFLAATLALLAGTVHGQIFVANSQSSTIGEYTTSGATVNASLVSGLNGPTGLAVVGNDLFVANYSGTIGEYTTSGALVNASLVSGLYQPVAIAVEGNNLFVLSHNGYVGEYTTSGATVNSELVLGLNNPYGLAVSGNALFVASVGNNTIGEYTTSGATVNASLVSGLGRYNPWGLEVVPEPSTMALIGIGMGALYLIHRRLSFVS